MVQNPSSNRTRGRSKLGLLMVSSPYQAKLNYNPCRHMEASVIWSALVNTLSASYGAHLNEFSVLMLFIPTITIHIWIIFRELQLLFSVTNELRSSDEVPLCAQNTTWVAPWGPFGLITRLKHRVNYWLLTLIKWHLSGWKWGRTEQDINEIRNPYINKMPRWTLGDST